MKQPLLIILCLSLCFSMSGCKKAEVVAVRKENSGGSGYGVTQKSSISLSDLYFFSVNTTEDQVLAALGSPQKYTLASDGAVTYILDSGATLELTYNLRKVIKTARYIDESGNEQNLFSFLVKQQALESSTAPSQNPNTGVGNQVEEAEKETAQNPSANKKPATDSDKKPATDGSTTDKKPTTDGSTTDKKPTTDGSTTDKKPTTDSNTTDKAPATNSGNSNESYFATEKYSIDIASKLLAEGAKRQKILSALGKPHGYSSVAFAKDSYIIDVYHMQDGSIYYLDYGYERETLRAVQVIKGSSMTNLLGSWGQEERPKDFYYVTRNLTAFSSLKRGAKPSDVYRRFGDPNWYEGNATSYKDAYQLIGGAVLYLDFGAGHGSLIGATVRQKDGSTIPYTLR